MSVSSWHLAQLNIAKMRAPLNDPVMAEFVRRLDEINALADDAPGFVWRLREDLLSGPDPVAHAYAAEGVIVNMSVWETVEALRHFVYHTAHQELLKGRRDWFEKMEERWSVMWWVPAGHIPTVAEGKERLEALRANGSTDLAFDFKQPFPIPEI